MPVSAAGLVLFDAGADALSPLCDTRPVFDVRTGACTTRERVERALGQRAAALLAPEALAPILRESASARGQSSADAAPRVNALPEADSLLFVNGALVIPPADVAGLPVGAALLDEASGVVVAACLSAADARAFAKSFELPARVKDQRRIAAPMLTRWWDVIAHRDAAIALDLDLLLKAPAADALREAPAGAHVLGEHRVVVSADATVWPAAVLDAGHGPIVIDAGAVIRPTAVIRGPAFVGAGSTILEHSLIKEHTAIGPACKIAGEVGGTIVQGWSNKAHAGHLGDAWIGQWVNLGADTTNSNLLNTYSEVRAPAGPDQPARQPTGLRFLGCAVGDHVKTAIGTRIMTGSAIGVGAMIATAAPPPQAAPTFAWLTDKGRSVHEWERFVATARAMMQRRSQTLSSAQERLLGALHRRAASAADADA